MPEDSVRIFPKSSAFEMLLGKVQLDLWEAQTKPALYYQLVRHFVRVSLPSMFQDEVRKKIDFDAEFGSVEKEINKLRKKQQTSDALIADDIEKTSIPETYMEFAEKVWHTTVDVLTAAGMQFPMAKAPAPRDTE